MGDLTIMEKSFYLTSLFTDIKTQSWSTTDIKVSTFILKNLSEYKIYLPELSKIDNFDEEIINMLKKVPQHMSISKFDLMDMLNIDRKHIARETNKIVSSMHNRSIINSYDLSYDKSVKGLGGVSWFEYFHHNVNGGVDFKFTDTSLRLLLLMIRYVKIDMATILSLTNSHAILSFILFKTLRDASRKTEETISIRHFKDKLGLRGKYSEINLFRIRVLDVVQREINEHTNIDLNYKLIKEGRAYTKIKFTFDYKPESIEEQKSKNITATKQETHFLEDHTQNDFADVNSPFEHTLTGWGIRARKVVEIEEIYSLDAISKSIYETIKAESANKIKSTKASFFLGVLENKQKSDDEIFEREQVNAHEQQEKEQQKALGVEYDAIQMLINDNEDEISTYLSVSSAGSIYELGADLNEQLKNLSCLDAKKFLNFRPRLAVLDNGYFDMKTKTEMRPNMYDFLITINQ